MNRILLVPILFIYCNSYGQPVRPGDWKPMVIPCTPVKNQYLSGTCWSFSSISLLESELLRAGKGETDLSEMFIARYSMLRKIHRHLKLKGTNYFTPGGQFHDAIWVIKNFGLVPEEVYSGKGRGEFNHDHGEMDTLLSRFVKHCIKNGIMELDTKKQHYIDSLLDRYYGRVPAEFVYKGRSWTPHSFSKQYLGLNPDDYVEISSYIHRPFYAPFILEDKYNWTGDMYWNVPLSDFVEITNSALAQGYTVGWDGDASDTAFNYLAGYASLETVAAPKRPATRQLAFEDQTTLLDHMMHIVGKTTVDGRTWYYVKNSWGNSSNSQGGFLYMNDDYFTIRTVAIIVNKAAIPAKIRQRMSL